MEYNFWSPENLIKATYIVDSPQLSYPLKMRWSDRHKTWHIFNGVTGNLRAEDEGTRWIRGHHANDSDEVKAARVALELSR